MFSLILCWSELFYASRFVSILAYISVEVTNVFLNVADVITLSSDGSILRAWNLPDGQMVWESSLQGSKASKSILNIPVSVFSFLLSTISFVVYI